MLRFDGGFRSVAVFLLTVAIFLPADLISKSVVFDALRDRYPQEQEVWEGVFKFRLVENPGMMWGMAQSVPAGAWVIIRGGVLIMLVLFFLSLDRRTKMIQVAFGLVTAGAMGNISDNIFHEKVRDFLHFYWFEFPTFNVADSCICVGAPLLLILLWNHDRLPAEEAV